MSLMGKYDFFGKAFKATKTPIIQGIWFFEMPYELQEINTFYKVFSYFQWGH